MYPFNQIPRFTGPQIAFALVDAAFKNPTHPLVAIIITVARRID